MAKKTQPQYWLMKSEPDVFSIDDLKNSPKKTAEWDGVRNYQARNFMREMHKGDLILFYHSNAEPPGIAGLATVATVAHPDSTQFDKQSKYYDPKSSKDNPRWQCVDVKYHKKFKQLISLADLKARQDLKNMLVVQKGSRLSVQPVAAKHFNTILKIAGIKI